MSAELAPPVHYETVAAAQTAQVLGSANATDRGQELLKRLIIVPASVSPGVVTIIDGSTSIAIFPGGANSLTELKPIVVDLEINSGAGNAWSVTTGASIAVIAVGRFK